MPRFKSIAKLAVKNNSGIGETGRSRQNRAERKKFDEKCEAIFLERVYFFTPKTMFLSFDLLYIIICARNIVYLLY